MNKLESKVIEGDDPRGSDDFVEAEVIILKASCGGQQQLILIALLIIYAMFRSSRRPRDPAPPQRFSFGRMLLVALFLAGLAFLVT